VKRTSHAQEVHRSRLMARRLMRTSTMGCFVESGLSPARSVPAEEWRSGQITMVTEVFVRNDVLLFDSNA
jgi:hypothetical protein